jgi:hypothetical protein
MLIKIATTNICGLCSVRAFPMLSISARTNVNIRMFAAMQDIFKPRTAYPLRMRSEFNIAVKSKAKTVPKIQILPV